MDDVAVNPTTGLPMLLTALVQSGKESSQQESVKRNVPRIFELLPKAMESLSVTNSKPVLAACSVIERCVRAHNEPAASGVQPTIDGEYLRQCQRRLVILLNKAQEKAANSYWEDNKDCDISSREVEAIALATIALFKLENHSKVCKQELKESGGIVAALKAMKPETSGIKREAKQSLAWMLSSYLDNSPENVEGILASGSIYVNNVLCPYVEEPAKCNASEDMQVYCRTVLEACLQHGDLSRMKSLDDIQRAIDKSRQAS